MRLAQICLPLCLSVVILAGCRIDRADPDRDPLLLEPDPEFVLPQPVGLEELQEEARRLSSLSREFPARGETEHYALMRETLGHLLVVVPTLRGTQIDGATMQQLRTMHQSRQQLRPESPFLPTDVTVTMALRAAYNALVSTAIAGGFGDDVDIEEDLAQMRDRVEELDRVRGPIHRLVAGQAMRRAADVVHRMTVILAEEIETPSPGEPDAD